MTQPTRRQLANAIRFLAADAVEAAKSGHPGMPMGMADIAEVLWNDYHRHNPNNPNWFNRDRFVLSNGHGSMLQYALLHLSGYDLPLQELKNFRQLHSRTAGVPSGSLPVVALICTMVGVPAEGIGLVLGVNHFLDMCRTTVNVTGDLGIAALVSKGERDDDGDGTPDGPGAVPVAAGATPGPH